jgi:hypothetical protein
MKSVGGSMRVEANLLSIRPDGEIADELQITLNEGDRVVITDQPSGRQLELRFRVLGARRNGVAH